MNSKEKRSENTRNENKDSQGRFESNSSRQSTNSSNISESLREERSRNAEEENRDAEGRFAKNSSEKKSQDKNQGKTQSKNQGQSSMQDDNDDIIAVIIEEGYDCGC